MQWRDLADETGEGQQGLSFVRPSSGVFCRYYVSAVSIDADPRLWTIYAMDATGRAVRPLGSATIASSDQAMRIADHMADSPIAQSFERLLSRFEGGIARARALASSLVVVAAGASSALRKAVS